MYRYFFPTLKVSVVTKQSRLQEMVQNFYRMVRAYLYKTVDFLTKVILL